ncbi:MAG: hypothetical protein GY827_03175 [Cytophagales bacterium]|nr:hypothetical protein [Cytophagales bacterium]
MMDTRVDFRNKKEIVWGHKEQFFGQDELFLYKDKSFYMYHNNNPYEGNYHFTNDSTFILDTKIDYFLPLRKKYPDTLFINIQAGNITDFSNPKNILFESIGDNRVLK